MTEMSDPARGLSRASGTGVRQRAVSGMTPVGWHTPAHAEVALFDLGVLTASTRADIDPSRLTFRARCRRLTAGRLRCAIAFRLLITLIQLNVKCFLTLRHLLTGLLEVCPFAAWPRRGAVTG